MLSYGAVESGQCCSLCSHDMTKQATTYTWLQPVSFHRSFLQNRMHQYMKNKQNLHCAAHENPVRLHSNGVSATRAASGHAMPRS